jgi:hypothetical protein
MPTATSTIDRPTASPSLYAFAEGRATYADQMAAWCEAMGTTYAPFPPIFDAPHEYEVRKSRRFEVWRDGRFHTAFGSRAEAENMVRVSMSFERVRYPHLFAPSRSLNDMPVRVDALVEA